MSILKELSADIVIIGGGTGGCAAALSAARAGRKVIMTEETDWIGGQLTNQAVPPDEHPWIEQFGCTATYREFRNRIRDYYTRNFPLAGSALSLSGGFGIGFNPGNAIVSRIAHEPRAALAVLHDMLAPYVHSGRLVILTEHAPIRVDTEGDRVQAVYVRDLKTNEELALHASYFLDATETGELLPLSGTEYVTGAESAQETGEPHALTGPADPADMQAFTWCFAVDHIEGGDFTIEKPEQYDFWKDYQADFWPDRQLSWMGLVPHTLEPVRYSLFPDGKSFSLWKYRRIIDRTNFSEGAFESDATLVNWPQNDYWLGNVIDVAEEERQRHLYGAKQLSLSLLYWMQTEAPRPDGGQGYPGMRLRKDIVGTKDGLAKAPYIRESRRIRAEETVVEQHLSPAVRGALGAKSYKDSVGIGCYRIDLHPSTGLRTYIDVSSYPFQIPLGALLPVRMRNLLPACKNIGTTHITNGCYRLHPVEWNIGEAAGWLAAFSLDRDLEPSQVRSRDHELEAFQELLKKAGVELAWPSTHAV